MLASDDGLRVKVKAHKKGRFIRRHSRGREGGVRTASLWLSYSLLIPVLRGMMDDAAPSEDQRGKQEVASKK